MLKKYANQLYGLQASMSLASMAESSEGTIEQNNISNSQIDKEKQSPIVELVL